MKRITRQTFICNFYLPLTFREFQDSFARLQRCMFHSCQFFTEIKRKVSLSYTERGVWILLRCVKTQMRIEKKQTNSLHYDNFVSEFFFCSCFWCYAKKISQPPFKRIILFYQAYGNLLVQVIIIYKLLIFLLLLFCFYLNF